MFASFVDELGSRSFGVLLGLILGGLLTWCYAYWRRRKERQCILEGDARDTVVIHQHIVETAAAPADGAGPRRVPVSLRIRALGLAELSRVVPNGHLASVFLERACEVSARDTLICMAGAEGSYLLETLTGFVCDRTANAPFEHDLYVMAPCCEPADLAQHQPITVLLIAARDLALFETWPNCKNVQVEHGGDGARILTLMNLAQRFRVEQEKLAELRKGGLRTKHVETMYVLDLPLDARTAPIPVKPVAWGRFEHVLKLLNVE